MKLKVIATISLLLGGVLFVRSITSSPDSPGQAYMKSESFVVHYIVSSSQNGGPLIPTGYYKRVVRHTGEWKETRYSFDGRISSLVSTQDGLYLVNEDSRQLVGESNIQFMKDSMGWSEAREKDWDNRPGLVRTEEVAGLKAYVTKNEQSTIEVSNSLRTGAIPLKTVIRANPGDLTPISVIEAIDVEFKEVSEGEVQAPPNLPMQFDLLQDKIKALKNAGRHRQAEMLEQTIQKVKANKTNY
ncbi:MAG TPA: hypothetical protein VF131_04375 [Blastocatellia bacterium]|nr:hypothetical protein [Blastocatellia bacterium]